VYKLEAEGLRKRGQVSGVGKSSVHTSYAVHPESYDYILEVKWPEFKSNPKVKNAWRYTSTYPYALITHCLIKHRGFNFIALKCDTSPA